MFTEAIQCVNSHENAIAGLICLLFECGRCAKQCELFNWIKHEKIIRKGKISEDKFSESLIATEKSSRFEDCWHFTCGRVCYNT